MLKNVISKERRINSLTMSCIDKPASKTRNYWACSAVNWVEITQVVLSRFSYNATMF